MNYIKVILWGEEIGRLATDRRSGQTYFTYNPENRNIPDIAPLTFPISGRKTAIPVYGEPGDSYHGLPPFIADSLPDAWGNELFDQWVKENRIPKSQITPLYKLAFIGRRGMGALEFEPADDSLEYMIPVDLQALYSLSIKVGRERESMVLSPGEPLTLHTLLAIGTSAGGRQMKSIIAMDPETGEIRSGQISQPDGFEYYIVKFHDEWVPTPEIEMAYYEMATGTGIQMEECRLIKADGVAHFITRRFDRKNNEKIHMQTLSAMCPGVSSYEGLFETCRRLNLSESEITELYRRLVFNVMANNTDDHSKNFSFLLPQGGRWKLSPAYDVTFIFNRYGDAPETQRCLTLYGRRSGINRKDLLEFARENNIRNAGAILDRTACQLRRFPGLAEKYGIPESWRHIIRKGLDENLEYFGYEVKRHKPTIKDSLGREITDISISVNRSHYLEVTAMIDGVHKRRHLSSNDELASQIRAFDNGDLDSSSASLLMTALFPM